MAITRDKSGVALSSAELPLTVNNTLVAPRALSLSIDTALDKLTVTFDRPCVDDGVFTGSDRARARNCTQSFLDLTLSNPVSSGNTITYDVAEPMVEGDVIEYSLGSVNFTCNPPTTNTGLQSVQVPLSDIVSGPPVAGAYVWTAPEEAAVVDGVGAEFYPWYSNQSPTLTFLNFGFAIPGGATITGVEAEMVRRKTGAAATQVNDTTLRLVIAGSPAGDNKADLVESWIKDVYTAKLYGGEFDDWGNILTPAIINAVDFGIVFDGTAAQQNSKMQIDALRLNIYYLP